MSGKWANDRRLLVGVGVSDTSNVNVPSVTFPDFTWHPIPENPWRTLPNIQPVDFGGLTPIPMPAEAKIPHQNLPGLFGDNAINQLLFRLTEFYGLPEEVRPLILALLREPRDKQLLGILADWLEEVGHATAGKARKVADSAA
jgi:hypothetical protein